MNQFFDLPVLAVPAVPVVIVVFLASCWAAVTDVWRFKVYNILTFPLLVSGLLYHLFTGGMSGLGNSTAGLLFGFGTLLMPYVMGAVGAGDVKFFAAIGAWLGYLPMLPILFIA